MGLQAGMRQVDLKQAKGLEHLLIKPILRRIPLQGPKLLFSLCRKPK